MSSTAIAASKPFCRKLSVLRQAGQTAFGIWKASTNLRAARAGFWRPPSSVYRIGDSSHRLWLWQRPLLALRVSRSHCRKADGKIASTPQMDRITRTITPEDGARILMEAIRLHKDVTGERPQGLYVGRCSMNSMIWRRRRWLDYLSDAMLMDLPLLAPERKDRRPADYSLPRLMPMICALPPFRASIPATSFLPIWKDSF